MVDDGNLEFEWLADLEQTIHALISHPVDITSISTPSPISYRDTRNFRTLESLAAEFMTPLLELTSSIVRRAVVEDGDDDVILDRVSRLISYLSGEGARGLVIREWILNSDYYGKKVSLNIREPEFAGADVGWKTWDSAILMARLILSGCIQAPADRSTDILELGCGTGLVGLTAASVLSSTRVDMTDFNDSVLKNCRSNIAANNLSHIARAFKLNWFNFDADNYENSRYPLILAADVIYSMKQADALPRVLTRLLAKVEGSQIHIVMPVRDRHQHEIKRFMHNMTSLFELLNIAHLRQDNEHGE